MKAEIISNGDEIASGKILDTNAQWLSRELSDLGITPLYHTTVGDDFDAMLGVLRIASQRADVILWTGGLGPTADDLTRQTIAKMADVPLERNEESFQHILELYKRRGHEMPPSNEIQAFQPQGAVVIRNPHGTAPGIDLTVKRTDTIPPGRLDFFRILAFPGVPSEMKEMWCDSAQQSLQDMLDGLSGHKRVLRFRSIHCFGKGESQIETLLPGLIAREHYPKVGITATQGTITLRIASEAESEEECFRIMEPTAREIYTVLGNCIFGEDDDTLQSVVCRELCVRGKTVAAVEVGTRGLLSESLAGNSESGGCFVGSLVLPPETKIEADRMIESGKRLIEAKPDGRIDYLLLVGPYPPGKPDRDRSENVFVAVADLGVDPHAGKNIIAFKTFPYVGHPGIIDDLYIKRALNLLRLSF